jgi:hypothetical protein
LASTCRGLHDLPDQQGVGKRVRTRRRRAAETSPRGRNQDGYQAFLSGLKARSDVTINEANLVKKDR